MANLFELKKQHAFALNKAENLLNAADSASREMTASEAAEYEVALAACKALQPQIAKIERQNTIQKHLVNGMLIPAAPGQAGGYLSQAVTPGTPAVFSQDYFNDFHAWIASGGKMMAAGMYEGSNPAGGFAVPILVEGNVVPLAPTELGVRSVATVIPTASDVKIPIAQSFGTAGIKAESGAADNFFTESNPTLAQFTLSAYMAGITHTCSWELCQDVPSFQQFAIADMVLALQMLEEGLYVTGTGTGQAQGL